MCSGSKTKTKPCPSDCEPAMEEDRSLKGSEGFLGKFSALLEFSASNDLVAFRAEVEEKGLDVDQSSFWYGRRIGSKKMGFEERTPLMIAAMFGSTQVLKYIIGSGKVDVNRACGSDKVTALHCAVAGASGSSVECVKVLLEAFANPDCVDANGNKPADLIVPALKLMYSSRKRAMELLLKGGADLGISQEDEEEEEEEEEEKLIKVPQSLKEVSEKKEFPIDVSLPDINIGVYMSDEFRMYTFKVKPCSRAYSHDWTECPFVHPGENARRRDPRKYPYSCVPCPEFRKGSCSKGDACEYAHGVFESWLHPAQYRTRLCKDEIGCTRKVCFFAHKLDELRPVYVATGSAMPSPKSMSSSALDMATLSPLALGSSSSPMPTPPMSPLSASSSPMGGNMWQNKLNLNPPALQLPGSRLKSALSARDMGLEMELLGLESHYQYQKQQQQQLMDEMSGLSSPSHWNREFSQLGQLKPTNLENAFGSFDPSTLSQLRCLSQQSTSSAQLLSPTGVQMRQNMNQLRASYHSDGASSPVRVSSPYGFDTSGAVAAAVMNSRSSAFAKRSQSLIDRGAARPGPSAAANSMSMMSSHVSDWGAPDGRLDWGLRGDELNKLRKSASFGMRNNSPPKADLMQSNANGPDVSWVNSLVKDDPSAGNGLYGAGTQQQQQQQQYNLGNGVQETLPPWVEQLYIEQERMAA